MLRLVQAALPKNTEQEMEGRAAARAIAGCFSSPEIVASGGPLLPVRKVRPTKGGRESGDRHEVVACDPCLPRETWTTRCGWRFAGAPHVISEDGEVTCVRCTRLALTGGGAGRSGKRPHE